MAFSGKKFIKRTLLFFLSVFLLISIAIGVVINFVFTPEKLTPKAVELANDYLNGQLELGSVELTFFSTFPDLEVTLKNGLLTSSNSDSLLSFESLDIFLNPVSIVSDEKIHVDKLAIVTPVIYANLDKGGVTNWNIVKEDTTAVNGGYTINSCRIFIY